MTNIQQLLISLFLLPAITQCMEMITTEPIIIQNLRKERQKIHNAFDYIRKCEDNSEYNHSLYGIPEKPFGTMLYRGSMRSAGNPGSLFLSYIYFYNHELASAKPNPERFTLDYLKTNGHVDVGLSLPLLKLCQRINTRSIFFTKLQPDILRYSALGIAAARPKLYLSEKKDMIQQLFELEFKPTPDDKELALLEKWERCAPLIIKKIHSFQHAPILSEMNVPQEIIPLIASLMWDTEESLL
jgi:hypothetical protein